MEGGGGFGIAVVLGRYTGTETVPFRPPPLQWKGRENDGGHRVAGCSGKCISSFMVSTTDLMSFYYVTLPKGVRYQGGGGLGSVTHSPGVGVGGNRQNMRKEPYISGTTAT